MRILLPFLFLLSIASSCHGFIVNSVLSPPRNDHVMRLHACSGGQKEDQSSPNNPGTKRISTAVRGGGPLNFDATINSKSNDLFILEDAQKYTVNVRNEGCTAINAYFFTNPAEYDGKTGEFSNSLGTKIVQPGGLSQAQFTYLQTFYAAAQEFTEPTGSVQTTSVSLVEMNLKTAGTDDGEKSELTFDSNDGPVLNIPMPVPGGIDGAFQIHVPSFPPDQGTYGVGLGAIADGVLQLASYTTALPGTLLSVQPITKFYIAVGNIERGADANFIVRGDSAAECDATFGKKSFDVVRTADGKWIVT